VGRGRSDPNHQRGQGRAGGRRRQPKKKNQVGVFNHGVPVTSGSGKTKIKSTQPGHGKGEKGKRAPGAKNLDKRGTNTKQKVPENIGEIQAATEGKKTWSRSNHLQ